VNFGEEAVGNVLAQHHLAGRGGLVDRGRHDGDCSELLFQIDVICAGEVNVDFGGKKDCSLIDKRLGCRFRPQLPMSSRPLNNCHGKRKADSNS
jgi:hypothetical protein